MRIVGKKESVEEFIKVIQADYSYRTMEFSYNRHMFRVFEADHDEIEERFDGKFQTTIYGYCAWSVSSCMLRDGYYGAVKKEYPDDFRGTTLDIESERLNLDIEVYSDECGMCFQEHYIITNGEIVCDECVDWEEYDVYDYDSKEDAEEDLDVKFTDEEWANQDDGKICRGGFPNWDFEI
jgi:hypothetical protein